MHFGILHQATAAAATRRPTPAWRGPGVILNENQIKISMQEDTTKSPCRKNLPPHGEALGWSSCLPLLSKSNDDT